VTENEEFALIYPTVFNYTVPVKENAESPDDRMGAGVLIDVEGRLFVATAGHCIGDKAVVLENDFSLPADVRVRILRKGIHPSLDIGFIELEGSTAIPILNRGECSLGTICLELPRELEMIHVVGFPEAARQLDDDGLTVVKKGFGTQFVEAQGNDYLFSYPKVGWTLAAQGSVWTQSTLDKTPKGYSGGGCWGFTRPKPSDLFTPEKHIRLYGIQRAWDKAKRQIKCVPIAFWLTFLCLSYPDLRPIIASRFPGLVP
jgi:hypothetical protein